MKPLQRAAAHFQRGEYDHVDEICAEIISADSANVRAWEMRGLAAIKRGQFQGAVEHLQRRIALQESPQAYINLAVAFLGLDRPADGTQALARSLELDPDNAGAHLNLGVCHHAQHSYEDAEQSFLRALELKPDWPAALDLLARTVLRRGDAERARDLATRALAADPSLSISHRVLGDIAMSAFDYDLSLKHYRLSLQNNPDDPETYANLGLLLTRRGEAEDAVALYERAASALPNDAPVQEGLGTALLMLGRLSEGWPFFAWRHLSRDPNVILVDQPFPTALPAPGSRAVAVLDQGLGDQVMFASLIHDLTARIPDLEVECDVRLHSLFRRSFPTVRFTPAVVKSVPGSTPTPGSFGLADTARWLRPDFAAFPRHSGYLAPHAALREELRARYAGRSGPVVGIAWASRRAPKLGRHKSLPLSAWGPLLAMPGITFVNLQYDSDPDEIAAARRQFGARIISDAAVDPGGDLDAFAAQVAAMDLVITTSNAAAHIAGALNVPAWVFVPIGAGAFWHWFLGRNDSPWYPSVRLFRQSKRGEWQDVVERASSALANFLETWRPQEGT